MKATIIYTIGPVTRIKEFEGDDLLLENKEGLITIHDSVKRLFSVSINNFILYDRDNGIK